MTTKELQRSVQARQTGTYQPSSDEQRLATLRTQGTGVIANDLRAANPVGTTRNENIGFNAAAAGWGQSMYDTGAYEVGMDLEHKRAIEQSGFSKILNGAVKGGVYALTTAVETTAGVIDGVIEGAYELAKQLESGEGVSLSKVAGAGVNNTVARSMVNIQRLSDRMIPNYRTQEERSDKYQDEWYKHVFTANFIGDSFLKNFGFTVGAMVGGAAWSKAISAGLKAMTANNLMRGVVASAEGNAAAENAIRDALKLVNEGAINAIDDPVVIQNLREAAKSLNHMSTRQQLIGGVISAWGEGTVEGVMARNSFVEDQLRNLNRDYVSRLNSVENDVINQFAGNEKYVREVPTGRDQGGNLIMGYELTPDGQQIVEERKRNLASDYKDNRDFTEELGDRIAATTFAWNLPILTVSNTLQYGRMLSGGFRTTRNTASKVAGGVAFREGAPVAEYAATGTLGSRVASNIAKNGLSEAAEEMSQGFVSSGATKVAENRLTAFNDDGYDEREMLSTANWVNGMLEGGMEYLKDGRNWQEGFLGLLTGLIGIPGRQWNGGIAEAVREAKSDFASSQAAAEALNSTINSERFQNAWKGYIRHQKYETEMGDAISRDDQYSWKTANDKQLISDIVMFADAGRLTDLKDIVQQYANITKESDLGAVDAATGEINQAEIQNNPDKKVESIKEQAQEILKTIDLYNDIYDSMLSLAPSDTSQDQIREMMATMMNIKAFESRYLSMFDDVLTSLSGFVEPFAAIADDNSVVKDDAEKLRRAKNIYSALAQAFTSIVIPSSKSEDLFDNLAASTRAIATAIDRMVEEHGDDQLKSKYNDMKKVAADRRAYVKKLVTLRDLPQGKFDEEKVTPDKVIAEQKKEKAIKETEGLKTLDDVKKAYFDKNAKEKEEFESTLEDAAGSNPNIDKFVKLKKRYDEFVAWTATNPITSEDITVAPDMIQSAINDLIRRSRSVDELMTLPDNVFTSRSSFNVTFQSPFGPTSPTAYNSVKAAMRNAMKRFAESVSQTESRESLNSQPVEQKSVGDVSNPQGYDASQPGSVLPAPGEAMPKSVEKEVQPEEQQAPQQIGTKPTPDEIVYDSSDAIVDTTPENAENEKAGSQNLVAYYRTSVPEIDPKQAKKAREAIVARDPEALAEADLSDFVESHPEYSEIWNALKNRGAFDAASQVSVGDEVELIVDPTFPDYKGKYQILLRNKKTGEILTVLNNNTSKTTYYGITELRKAIDDEYKSFREKNPNDVFVFGKTSTVWAKRPGLIEYGFTEEDEKPIQDIPSYFDTAPVVFIDRNGNAVTVRGNDRAVDKVSVEFTDPSRNRGDVDGNDRRGNLYYLAEDGRSHFIPIRLNVEHFKEDTKDNDNSVFEDIRKKIGKIAEIVASTNSSNLSEQNEKLHEEVGNLIKDLDLSGIFFELGDYENVGIALRINDGDSSTVRRPDQMTPEWLIDHIAGYNRSVQIHQNASGEIQNLPRYISAGVITSNAKKLRAKGVDFYMNPWIADKQEFGPVTETQVAIADEIAYNTHGADNVGISDMPDASEFGDRDEDNDFLDNPEPDNTPTEEEVASAGEQAQAAITGRRDNDPVMLMIDKPFSKLPKKVRTELEKKGWTADTYNKLRKEQPGIIEKELRCAGV